LWLLPAILVSRHDDVLIFISIYFSPVSLRATNKASVFFFIIYLFQLNILNLSV
jgi:hypothetical protein